MVRDLAVLALVFAVVTAIAALLGAANLGTAMTFGQIVAVVGAGIWIVRGREAR